MPLQTPIIPMERVAPALGLPTIPAANCHGVEQTFRSAVMIAQKSFLAPQARAQQSRVRNRNEMKISLQLTMYCFSPL
jgi:hypothetical protein